MYKPDPATLARLRSAIDADASGGKLHTLVTSLRRKGYRVETHQMLTSAPRDYSAEHPRIERVLTDVTPLRDWLQRHIG